MEDRVLQYPYKTIVETHQNWKRRDQMNIYIITQPYNWVKLTGNYLKIEYNKWDNVFQSGPSKICGRQLLKNLKNYITVVHNDTISSVGSMQMYAGYETGCKAWIHTMHTAFEDDDTVTVVAVDAPNAFNSANREVLLNAIFIGQY